MTKKEAIKQLYDKAEDYYHKMSEKYAGEWISGSTPGLGEYLAYKRALLITEAKDETEVDKYVNMNDIEIIHANINDDVVKVVNLINQDLEKHLQELNLDYTEDLHQALVSRLDDIAETQYRKSLGKM